MAGPILLSEEDRDILDDLLRQFSAGRLTTEQRAAIETPLMVTPELYVAKIPEGGIPGRVGLTPSSAYCLVHQLVPRRVRDPNGGLVETGTLRLLPVTGFTRRVYNLGLLPLVEFARVPVTRDKFGTWWTVCSPCLWGPTTPETGTGTGPDTGTGTGTGTGTFNDIPNLWLCCTVAEPTTGTGTGPGETTPIVTSWPAQLNLTILAIRPGSCFNLAPRDLSCVVGATIPLTIGNTSQPGILFPFCYAGGFFRRSNVCSLPGLGDGFHDYTTFGPFVDCIHIVMGSISCGESDAGTVGDKRVYAQLCCDYNPFFNTTGASLTVTGDLFYGIYGTAVANWDNQDGAEVVGDGATTLFNFCQTFATRPVNKTFTLRYVGPFGCGIWAEVDFLLSEP